MARAKKAKKTAARARGKSASRSQQDAIAFLKADHRQVEQWFEEFEKSRSDARKETLARQICRALEVHTQIEAEIFYPAFLEATEETDIHHEAEVEHEAAKKLIAEIEDSDPGDDYFDAKVTVLSEMIKHHVREEEKSDGMFAEAKRARMDLKQLGERLAARKQELESGNGRAGRAAGASSQRATA